MLISRSNRSRARCSSPMTARAETSQEREIRNVILAEQSNTPNEAIRILARVNWPNLGDR